METALKNARRIFFAERAQEQMSAVQRAALQIIAGLDIDRLMDAPAAEKQQAASRLTRLIERERLKGVGGHWSYDLNRHIALKQALDRLEGKVARAMSAQKRKSNRSGLSAKKNARNAELAPCDSGRFKQIASPRSGKAGEIRRYP